MFATVNDITSVVPPYPLYSYYFCGQEFLELPKAPSGPKTLIVVFEYGHCTIAVKTDDSYFHILREIKEYFPKKQRAGGQSAPRFDRLRLEAQKHFNKKIKEILNKISYQRLCVGGPGLSKTIWERKGIANAEKVVGCQYNGFSGIREIIQKLKYE